MRHDKIVSILQNLTNQKPKQKDLAQALGVDISRIGKRASRNSDYSFEDLEKINKFFSKKYSNFDLFDAIHNTKSICNSNNLISLNFENSDNLNSHLNVSNPIQPFDTISVDYYPDILGSFDNKNFVFSSNKEKINIPAKFIYSYSPKKKYFIINACGNSMIPTIIEGDKLIVEHQELHQIIDNKIYLFLYNSSIFVKRLIYNVDQYIIKSDNPDPAFQQRIINKYDIDNMFIIGKITGLFRYYVK